MYTQEEINLITLSSFEKLSYKHRFKLLSELTCAEPDFEKSADILIKSLSAGVYNKVKGNFYSRPYREKVIEKLDARGIKCVTYFSKDYPEQLKFTPCPPIVLFCKGNVKLLSDRLFAIVGSRRTQPAAIGGCKNIANELAEYFTIVTGSADGADTAAIEGALSAGKIISVLAYGFDRCYPAVNENLLKEVEKRGLLVTEYTPQIPPVKYNFPVRNRIIASLAEGVLVVSAGKKSGAGITARYALEYGKRVFAFPYSIGVASGEGCNALIREGATLARDAGDVLEDFGIKREEKPEAELSEEERACLEIIRQSESAFLADVADKLQKLPFQIIPVLTELEIRGLIVRLGGNRYSAVTG